MTEPVPLDANEVPTLVFGALTRWQYATCLVLRFTPGGVAARRVWLRTLAGRLTYGIADRNAPAHVLALAASGLTALGLDTADLDTFSAAFVNGMTAPYRSRALGDEGDRRPGCWDWGNDAAPADALLFIYALSQAQLSAAVGAVLLPPDVHLVQEIKLQVRAQTPSGFMVEPFGFLDGISQPLIPGTPPAAAATPQSNDVVAAGEFVLGYADSHGYLPAAPTVASANDPDGVLPTASNGQRDIGRNSTFLVVRQLRQDVAAFDNWVAGCAAALSMPADYIAAQLIGRWQNGTSLVRNPRAPGTDDPDNDFLFRRDDPRAFGCPRGAHIRRSNPRDALHAKAEQAVRITNRHRILRVGRPYIVPPHGNAGGMLFMCLNTEIERQFEFLQQTWVLGPSFDGLRDETDPLVGANGGTGALTVQGEQGPQYLAGMPDFVTPIGGGYFWLPSRTAVHYLSV